MSASQASSPLTYPAPLPTQIPLDHDFTVVLISNFSPGNISLLNLTIWDKACVTFPFDREE